MKGDFFEIPSADFGQGNILCGLSGWKLERGVVANQPIRCGRLPRFK